MAIDVFKRQGKSAVTGLLGKNLRRVAGNIGNVIRGDIGGADSSVTAPINRTQQSTKMLTYPLDVGADPGIGNNGHYIMFFINEQKSTKLKFGDETDKPEGAMNIQKELQKRKIPAVVKQFDSKTGGFLQKAIANLASLNLISGYTDVIGNLKTDTTGRIKHNPVIQKTRVDDKNSSIVVERAPTTRLDTAIAMYMPTNIKVSYGVDITDTPIGQFTDAVVDVVQGGMSEAQLAQSIENELGEVGDYGIRQGLKGLGEVPGFGGALEAKEMMEGVIFADRMELAFKGVGKRNFSYEFKMMPRSQAEADQIQEIIYAFKFNMLPEFVGDTKGRKLKVPNTFDIQYMYQNAENSYLNKVSTCFLEKMDVSYGGERYKTFDASSTNAGAPPVETTISLNFLEIELITRERVAEGF
mgnify:FL=1